MKRLWTDFLTTDGENTWRNRDLEFESMIKTRSELLDKWNKGWACVFNALDSINETNFYTEIYFRNQVYTIFDAANRQSAHYTHPIGQITYIGKTLKGNEWKSRTIPKGKSTDFN